MGVCGSNKILSEPQSILQASAGNEQKGLLRRRNGDPAKVTVETFPNWNYITATYLVIWRENVALLCTLPIDKNEHAPCLLYSGDLLSK